MHRRIALVCSAVILLFALLQSRLGGSASAQLTAAWVNKASLPLAVTGPAAATGNDGRVYVFGGTNGVTNVPNAWVYTPSSDKWSAIAPMPLAVSFTNAATVADGRIFVVGGWDGQEGVNWVQAYDPATNSWSCSFNGAGCTATNLAPMPTPRAQLGVALGPGNTVYAIGGAGPGPLSTVEVYDVTANTWSTGPSFPYPAAGVRAEAGPGGSIYAYGGHDAAGIYHFEISALVPSGLLSAKGRLAWRQVGNPPPDWSSVRQYYTQSALTEIAEKRLLETIMYAFAPFNDFYLGGHSLPVSRTLNSHLQGQAVTALLQVPDASGSVGSTSTAIWDSTTNAFSPGPPMRVGQVNAGVATDNGTVYVIGGDDGGHVQFYNTVEAYTPPPPPPTPTATATPTTTATSTATATATPTATPTSPPSPRPLTLALKLSKKRVSPGSRETVTVSSDAGVKVQVTVSFPGGRKLHHSGASDPNGKLAWRFKEPALPRGVKTHRVKVAVTVTDSSGQTASTSGHYTGG